MSGTWRLKKVRQRRKPRPYLSSMTTFYIYKFHGDPIISTILYMLDCLILFFMSEIMNLYKSSPRKGKLRTQKASSLHHDIINTRWDMWLAEWCCRWKASLHPSLYYPTSPQRPFDRYEWQTSLLEPWKTLLTNLPKTNNIKRGDGIAALLWRA